jgi:hypothetical protein
MVDRLSEWDDYRQFAHEFALLLRSQQDVRKSADELTTLGKRLDELSSSERADLIRLSTQQGSLIRQFDRLIANMLQFNQQLDETASAQSETLMAATRLAGEEAVTEHMLQAKLTLSQNQLGIARSEIGQVEAGLQVIVDMLTGRSQDGLARTRRLSEISGELDELTAAENNLRQQFTELGDIPNPVQRQAAGRELAKQQSALVQQAREIAETLKKIGAEDAAASVEHGTDRARRAAELASDGQAEASARAADDAERRFAEAGQKVAEELRRARESALRRVSARFTQAVSELAKAQRTLQDRFHTDQQRQQDSKAAEMQEALALEQHALADTTDSTRDQFQPPKALGLALTWAARSMREAAARLRSNAMAEEVAALQSDALRRLQALLETLQAAATSPPNPGSNAGGPDGQGERKAARYSEAELRIVLEMQTEIHERTTELEKDARAARSQGARIRLKRERLAADQKQLSEVVGELAASPDSETTAAPQDASSLDEALEQAVEDVEASQVPSSEFDPRLLEGLDARSDPPAGEDLGQPSDRDPVSIVAERMGRVARRIIDDETLQPAQQIQQEILRELTRLAEEAAQQSQQQTSRTPSPPRASQQGDEGLPPSGGATAGASNDVDPIEAVWGTLPERVRQGIRSPLHEEFLPEYEHIIQAYYKRLAEQRRLRSDR